MSTLLWDSVSCILQADRAQAEGGRESCLRPALTCIRSLVTLDIVQRSNVFSLNGDGERANVIMSTSGATGVAQRSIISAARAVADNGCDLRDISMISWSAAKLGIAPQEAINSVVKALQVHARSTCRISERCLADPASPYLPRV